MFERLEILFDGRVSDTLRVWLPNGAALMRAWFGLNTLGAVYTPIAVALGLAAWLISGDAVRFLAVMVVATPCPLLIAIPVAIIGSISLAARRAIVIRDPTVLENQAMPRRAIV